MSHETNDLKQRALLWAANGCDRDGQPTVDAVDEIDVRWVYDTVEGLDAQGNKVSYNAQVAAAQDIPLESVMWLGEEVDFPTNSANYSDLYQVKQRKIGLDVKGQTNRYEYLLMRFANSLPTIG